MPSQVFDSFKRSRVKTTDYCEKTRREFWHDYICSIHFGFFFDAENWNGYSADISQSKKSGFQLVRSQGKAATLRRENHHICADSNDVYEFMAPVRGSVTIEQNDHISEYRIGQVALIDASKPFIYRHDKPFSAVFFMVPRGVLDQQVPLIESVCGQPINCTSGLAKTTIDYFHSVVGELEAMNPLEHATATKHLLDLLALMMEPRTDFQLLETVNRSTLLAAMKVHISNHITFGDLSAHSIAAVFGCSARYVQMIFKSSGTKVSRYICQQRLKYARELLRSPLHQQTSITAIAYRCNFSSNSHFGATFKAQFGVSPLKFRKSAMDQILSATVQLEHRQ